MYTVNDAEGTLEIITEGLTSFGYVTRDGADRLYVGAKQIQCLGLKSGDYIRGKIRAPRQDELAASFVLIDEVNGKSLQTTN
jgi:transcription termination factor Rho